MSTFTETLDMLGAPLFVLPPDGPVKGYWAPPSWPAFTAGGNADRLAKAGPGAGYGMVTGQAFTVLDLDPRNREDVLAWLIKSRLVPVLRFVVRTPSGGWHLYVDPLGTGSFALEGLDIKDAGGFVFAPPTDGYHLLPEDEWPAGLAEAQDSAAAARLRAEKAEGAPKSDPADLAQPLDVFGVRTRLEGVYARMAATPHGERNNTLNVLAGTAAGLWVRLDEDDQRGALSEDAIKDRLLESVPDDGDPEKSRGTLESGWAYGLGNPVPDRDPELVTSGFFAETPVLQHIQTAAHSRGMKAPVVLASVLAYVLRETHPQAFLPATVGSNASLNLGFALVGDSGAGKSAGLAVAAELLGLPGGDDMPIGSGEGMIDAFYEEVEVETSNGKTKKELWPLPVDEAKCLFTADEGETLKRLGDRSGTTLAGFLRTALTGGTLGTTNSKRGGNNRRLEGNTYRLVMIINVHPTQADVLLDGDGVGMPQRFLWMPSEDKDLPTRATDLPVWPGSLSVKLSDIGAGVVLDYPVSIQEQIKQDNLDRTHGTADPRLAHANLTRLKTAQTLALLHEEPEITERWWRLAGQLSDLSLATQDMCSARLATTQQEQRNTRAKAEGRAADAADEDRFVRGVRAVVEKLRKRPGEELSWHDARPRHALRKDYPAEEFVAALKEQAGVSVRAEAKGGGHVHFLRYDP